MMATLSPADRELIAGARAGSHEALEALFRRHWLEAWRAAYGITASRDAADDVVQDAFERAFRGLGSFGGRGSFAAWLHRIVVNRALDLVRRERASLPLEAVGDLASEDQPGVDQELLAALAALPVERRAVVVLRHWLGHSLRETAEILELPLGTVQSRLARGLEELRARLGDGG